MAFDPWITQQNIDRFHRLLKSEKDPNLRATLEALLEAEEAKLPLLEASKDEKRRKINRWRDKAEELRTVADQTANDRARATFRQAADNYDTLAQSLEQRMADAFDAASEGAG